MNDIIIEQIKKEQVNQFWPTFKRILKKEFTFYPPLIINYFLSRIYTPYSFRFWIEKNYKNVIIARKNEKIIGFAVIDRPYGGVSFCRWLGVTKKEQKKGIGSRLVKEWIKIAKEKDCHKIEIASQPGAIDFYNKVGLKKEGVRKKSYFGVSQHIFGKIISEPEFKSMTDY